MAYVIGALGASVPLRAGIGAVGGIAGMLILYGVGHEAAVAACCYTRRSGCSFRWSAAGSLT
jgi:hypothetical protein